jgi:hypothetical protein
MESRWIGRPAIVLTLLLASCTVAPEPRDGVGPITDGAHADVVRSTFKQTAADLAGRGMVLERMPENAERILSLGAIRSIVDTRFGADFRIHGVHLGLVDIPDDHFEWSNEPMYVVERTGRGSRCFDFFDAMTGEYRLGAC